MFIDSCVEMGEYFKNLWLIKLLGWVFVIGLIYFNMKGLFD